MLEVIIPPLNLVRKLSLQALLSTDINEVGAWGYVSLDGISFGKHTSSSEPLGLVDCYTLFL